MGGTEYCPHCNGSGIIHKPLELVYYSSSNASPAPYSWFGYESPKEGPLTPSQFWRHFKKCLRDIPEIIPVARICEVILRPIFAMRSHPRWRSRRWKAKT